MGCSVSPCTQFENSQQWFVPCDRVQGITNTRTWSSTICISTLINPYSFHRSIFWFPCSRFPISYWVHRRFVQCSKTCKYRYVVDHAYIHSQCPSNQLDTKNSFTQWPKTPKTRKKIQNIKEQNSFTQKEKASAVCPSQKNEQSNKSTRILFVEKSFNWTIIFIDRLVFFILNLMINIYRLN